MSVQIQDAGLATRNLVKRIERKFYLTPEKIRPAYGILRHICRRDEEYPSEQINSLYFDTADLDQHNRSLAGEFRKDKVRIRWYNRDDNRQSPQTVYLELKTREGYASTKQRLKIQVQAEVLALNALSRGIVAKSLLNETLAGFGYIAAGSLQPVIKISYWRDRFVDIFSGQRLALDSHIRSSLIMPGQGYAERDLELPGGVIEVKSASLELPITLRQINLLDLDWSRFSKYSSCLDAHNENPDALYRLAPFGLNMNY